MVTLKPEDLKDDGRKSSKGNQLKWNKDGVWYKADYTGYEGLAEYVISHLLMKSTLAESEFVLYDLERISYKESFFNGAKSLDMLGEGWQIITLERLIQNHYGKGLNKMIYAVSSHENRLNTLVDCVQRLTGIEDFGVYMSKMLTIDTFFLNEDRHTHNMAVLMNGKGEFSYCPIFDQGAGLLSDTTLDYPLTGDVYKLIKDAKPKTFCDDFDEQLDITEKFFGENIKFSFDKKDVDEILAAVPVEMYDSSVLERVRTILYLQMAKYQYLFQ